MRTTLPPDPGGAAAVLEAVAAGGGADWARAFPQIAAATTRSRTINT
jgi:hypothetical protein